MSINLSEMIWTIINFLLLMFLLKLFLYNPLLRFMDEKRAHISEGLAEGERARQAMEENTRLLAADLQKSSNEARKILNEAKTAYEEEKAEILNRANEKAASLRHASVQRIADEEKASMTSVEECFPELVSVLTFRLLGEAAPSK